MKKRIVCVLLTLIMLLSLVPMGASAASNKTSEAAITVLKQMTTLRTQCYYYSGSEFRTGYGTVCDGVHHFKLDLASGKNVPDNTVLNDDDTVANIHHITEKNADLALRKALTSFDEKVNSFATSNGLTLSQNQHDALVVFSYNAGTGWMSGNGVLKSAIVNGCSATELLNAMLLWSNQAGNGNTTELSRRKVEVNMYINGIYSNTAPAAYGKVTYNPDGGDMPQANFVGSDKLYTYHFDLYATLKHPVTPTRNGYKFLGWYLKENGYIFWFTQLNSDLNGKTLTALWQPNNSTNGVAVNYQLSTNHLVNTDVYKAVTDAEPDTTLTETFQKSLETNGTLFFVDRDMIDAKGNRWSHLKSINGWVKVGPASDNNSFTDSVGKVIATATVTANGYLNLRQDAGTDAKIIGALAKNDTVDIYEIKTVNGHQWGRCKSGWLCLTYARLTLKDDVTISNEGALAYSFTGTVANGKTKEEDGYTLGLKVHVEPGDNNNFVTYFDPDDDEITLEAANGTAVTVTNLAVYKASETWAKITWMNKEWQYTNTEKTEWEEIETRRSGWVKLVTSEGKTPANGNVVLNPVKYTVVADSVSVRNFWGDSSNLLMSLNKGVQVQVELVALVGENIWGKIQLKNISHVETSEEDRDATVNNTAGYSGEGYVNLASKYFTRDDAPTLEDDKISGNLIATVINTDSLKVRKTGATYGQQIGRLTRGTTVAVWEDNGKGWYKVDSNQNGEYDYKEDGWCSGAYLDIREGKVGGTVTDSNGNTYETDGTGKGIVANTYSGVNVRTGPSTGYATNGKLLPGSVVEILETANGGKWGRVAQGWICMDYVTMVSYNEVINTPAGGTTVESFDQAEKTTTTAVYTGKMKAGAVVLRNPTKDEKNEEFVRNAVAGENVTIYELAKVTETIVSDEKKVDENTTLNTTTTITTYWARINDGWVENPEQCLQLNALDEKIHTQTGVSKLNVRREPNENLDNVFDVLVQGDQVAVTALTIVKDKVWGRIDTNEGTGWIRLDYMSEGAVYVKPTVQNNTTVTSPVLGNTSSTGGFVNNTSGYRYTGKVIRANSVKVRATPSLGAAVTTNLTSGQALVVYETTVAENMAWGRCDAGWVYLYYVDLTPVVNGAVDARVVYNDNTIIYSDVNCSAVAGTYARMSTIDIYEIVGKMARTELGWVNTDNLL